MLSSKSKLIIGIVLVAVGGGLIPTGILTNDYYRDAVYDGLPDALLDIKNDAVSEIQDMVPVLATPSVLLGAKDEVIENIKSLVAIKETPGILRSINATLEPQFSSLLNFAMAAWLMNLSYNYAESIYGPGNGAENFFNNPAYSDPYCGTGPSSSIPWNMSFTTTAQLNLLFYGMYDTILSYYPSQYFPMPIPGLITETDIGMGVGSFLTAWGAAYYFASSPVINDTYPMETMEEKYNATFLTQLGLMYSYIGDLFYYRVPYFVEARYGVDYYTSMGYGFYIQWANGTFMPDGLDLALFTGLEEELKGIEAGIPTATNIPLANTLALWDSTNPLSFTNDNGIYAWFNGTVKASTFGLSATQFAMVKSWLINFITNVSPTIIEYNDGRTMDEIGKDLFFEQWANGTIDGRTMIPDGVLVELDDEFEGPPYLEVGLPDPSNISYVATRDIWNEYNKLAFTNDDGFEVWLGTATNTTLRDLIIDEFNFTSAEVVLISEWLNDFMNEFTVALLEYSTSLTLAEYSFLLFYEQWANGTIDGREVIPDGFLSMRDPPIYGPPYFELGIEYACGLSVEQTEDLWYKWNDYALVSASGINIWYAAKEGNEEWNELVDHYNFNEFQILAITTWLPEFRDTLVNKLAVDDMDLPMEPYDLGNTLFFTLIPIGGVLAALGVVALILSRRS